jgi:hypothetical protein
MLPVGATGMEEDEDDTVGPRLSAVDGKWISPDNWKRGKSINNTCN